MASHMTPSRASSDDGVSGIRDAGGDAFQLTLDYLKQEAVTPLRGLGRFLAWGLAGSITMAVGLLLLLIGVLRVLQEETGTALTGDWSWVPYFVVAVLGIGVVSIAAWRVTAGTAPPMLPQTTGSAEVTKEGTI